MTTFTELGLDPALLKALASEGYEVPTPIQAKAIPGVMEGRDLLGIAQTGTGKTAAFALPILHRLNKDRRPAPRRGARVLILSPTRELATQIAESFKTYGKHMGFTVAIVFGGVAHKPQRDALARGIDILVATPGRLIDHIDERNASIETTEILVLDEADQMLDMGFIRPIRQILSKLPSRRQSLFFSATMPQEIGALAAEMLRDPLNVSVTPVAKTADRVAQKVIHVEAPKKKALLAELLADAAMSRTLMFTRTKRGADRVARYLESKGIGVAAIHGNKSQAQRERALADFKAGRIRGLVATDIAARGIDIDLVTHVVNYELPNIPESYVHRIGRTARAGAEGIAISFCDGEERAYLRDIERLTRQQIPSEDRRGDTTLVAEQRSAAQAAEERSEERRGDRRSSGNGARGGRSERPSRPPGEGRERFGRDSNRRSEGARAAKADGETPRHRDADRGPRPDRPERADRPHRGARPQQGDRPPHADRSERGRGDRFPKFGENPQRPDRPSEVDWSPLNKDRVEIAERPERSERSETRGDRGSRPAFRANRDDRRPAHGGEHRGPREDRGGERGQQRPKPHGDRQRDGDRKEQGPGGLTGVRFLAEPRHKGPARDGQRSEARPHEHRSHDGRKPDGRKNEGRSHGGGHHAGGHRTGGQHKAGQSPGHSSGRPDARPANRRNSQA